MKEKRNTNYYVQAYIDVINEELRKEKKLDSIETMACSVMPIEDICLIVFNSNSAKQIKNIYGDEALISIYNYIKTLKLHVQELTKEGLIKFDSDVSHAKHPSKIQNRNHINNDIRSSILNLPYSNGSFFVVYKKMHTNMNAKELEKTLEQFKKAVGVYYETYEGREIKGRLIGFPDGEDREIKMEVKAKEVLHILGITRQQVLANDEFRYVLNLRGNETAPEILKSIYQDICSEKRLLEAHTDSRYQSELLPYNKIRSKTLSFMKTGTFAQPKLLCQIAPGKKLGRNPMSNVATICQHGLSRNYTWAYLGGVYRPETNTQYTETLINDSASGKRDKFSDQEPRMLVETEITSRWNGTVSHRCFTQEERIELYDQANQDFGGDGGMNFTYLEKSLGIGGRVRKK